MEPIARLDHISWVSSLKNSPVDDIPLREVLINNVKVFEFVFIPDLLVHLGKISSSLGGKVSDCLICIEPSPARRDFQTVQECIHSSICDSQRMSEVVQILVEDISISKPKDPHMASRGNCRIDPI